MSGLLTNLAAVSQCLELSAVTHTALLTPTTIKAVAVFCERHDKQNCLLLSWVLNHVGSLHVGYLPEDESLAV